MNGFRLIRQAASYGGLLNSHHHLPATVQLAINRKYSNALQTAAIKPDKLELLEDDLKRIAVAIDADSQFKDLILSNTANLVEKKSCINRMLNDQLAANDLTVRLVNSMIEKDLLRLLLTNDLQKTVSKLRAVINDLNETANSKGAGGAHTDFDSVGEFVRQIERVLQNYGRESSTSSIADAQQTALVAKELADLQFKSADPVMNQNLMSSWLKLSKYRLTSLVLVTTLAGHYMGVSAFDPQLMFFTLLGTGLCSSSAAALNQFLEIPYDSQMSRTKSRPLVAHSVTPLHAFTFAAVTGLSGVALLAANVNTLTASLGALNLILYSFIYTPMKRFNIANTWIGSIVGAIPPVMGYAAATGGIGEFCVSLDFPFWSSLKFSLYSPLLGVLSEVHFLVVLHQWFTQLKTNFELLLSSRPGRRQPRPAALLLAVSALQCALLEHQARLCEGRLPDDGGHQSGALRSNRLPALLADRALLRTDVHRPDRPEQLGVRRRFAADQPLFNPPRLEVQAEPERENVQDPVQVLAVPFASVVALSCGHQEIEEEQQFEEQQYDRIDRGD